MSIVTIRNLSSLDSRTVQAEYCAKFFCRLRGLTFRRRLASDTGLLMVYNRESRLDVAIHMLWMWIDLAVVWIDDDRQVVDVRRAYRWRSFLIPQKKARYVLELPLESLTLFRIGDQLAID